MTTPTRLDDPSRGGATWCDQHGRWECTRNKKASRGGGRCHGPAITGVDACRMHAGKRAEVAKAQGAAVSAWSAVAGDPTVSATEAVLGMLQMSWLRAHLYAGLLEQQVGAEGASGPDGLIGETRGASPGIGIYATGEAVRALAVLEAQERDRCVRFAKTAHDMGIAEQQITIAEQQGALLADAVNRILDGLNLTPEQWERVPEVASSVLRAVGGVNS